jgi:hypothetical protein
MEVNNVLNSPIIQNEALTAYILRYIVIKKRVTKDIHEDMELNNLMQQLNLDNQNKHSIPFQVSDTVEETMKKPRKKDGCGKS